MNEAKYDAVVFDLLTALIDSWSLWQDLRILLKTLKVVFAREGSC